MFDLYYKEKFKKAKEITCCFGKKKLKKKSSKIIKNAIYYK